MSPWSCAVQRVESVVRAQRYPTHKPRCPSPKAKGRSYSLRRAVRNQLQLAAHVRLACRVPCASLPRSSSYCRPASLRAVMLRSTTICGTANKISGTHMPWTVAVVGLSYKKDYFSTQYVRALLDPTFSKLTPSAMISSPTVRVEEIDGCSSDQGRGRPAGGSRISPTVM